MRFNEESADERSDIAADLERAEQAAMLELAIEGLPEALPWNWLMPPIFGVGTIDYWQAFGIVLLARILFGGFGGFSRRGSDHEPHRYTGHGRHEGWRRFWNEEGREAFRLYMRRRRGAEGLRHGKSVRGGSESRNLS